MNLTIAICTWNRSALLSRTLASLAEMRTPQNCDWELLVINNNCSDDTQLLLDSFSSRLPVRTALETRQGHSHSRNRAVHEARGRVIVWTDDDVRVAPDWLSAYHEAIRRAPEAAFWGGPIKAVFESPPPNWITDNWEVCAGVFAERNLGDRAIRLDAAHLPYGANFATQTEVQRQYEFRTDFGRVAGSIRGYEEIDVLNRMLCDGHTGYWVPQAKLEHWIPASRLTLRFVRDYFRGQGETWAIRGLCNGSRRQIRARCRKHCLLYHLQRPFFHSRRWFHHLVRCGNLSGQLAALQNHVQPTGGRER